MKEKLTKNEYEEYAASEYSMCPINNLFESVFDLGKELIVDRYGSELPNELMEFIDYEKYGQSYCVQKDALSHYYLLESGRVIDFDT